MSHPSSGLTRRSLLASAAAMSLPLSGAPKGPAPYGALPSARQLAWHGMEMYSFLHFTTNTFTDKEWGYGDENPEIFHPTDFNADAIITALKSAGMKGVILTCKHHDGFCLWPTRTTDHSVRKSKWMGGQGDVVRAISDAAHRQDIKFGVYLSPWDRNATAYGTPAYVDMYRAQLTELLTQYGPIYEVWHDGANGGDGYYGGARETRKIDKKTYYDWPTTWALVRKLQPGAVVFSDAGPDVRWVGNEKGIAGETCWATFDPAGEKGGPASPGDVDTKRSVNGTRGGAQWMPAECDVSIRPGWFWHEKEDRHVKMPSQLFDLYCKSVGRGASFLLNVPPDRRGQLHANDKAALEGLGQILRETFKQNHAEDATISASSTRRKAKEFSPANLLDGNRDTYWCTDGKITSAEVTLKLPRERTFDLIRLREFIQLGQRVAGYSVEINKDGAWSPAAQGESIGSCRLIRLDKPVTTNQVKLKVKGPVAPALSEFGLFTIPK